MVMNISCKFEKASYNIIFVTAVAVKSLYTLRWRRRNKGKSIVSTGCYPVDTTSNQCNEQALCQLTVCFEFQSRSERRKEHKSCALQKVSRSKVQSELLRYKNSTRDARTLDFPQVLLS